MQMPASHSAWELESLYRLIITCISSLANLIMGPPALFPAYQSLHQLWL